MTGRALTIDVARGIMTNHFYIPSWVGRRQFRFLPT